MGSPAGLYGIAEMNRRAEELTLKVRSELSRIGFSPGKLKVHRQGIFIMMQYRYQAILADPYEVLIVLKKISRDLSDAEIWEQINKKVRQVQRQNLVMTRWSILCVACLAVVTFLLLILTRG
ncbi:MAG TPA: hypothetical protein VJ974_05245 [Geopsychrobacteraceae bacterium]|nr:hypothetical protein [Geopsychrobacteraceae bacterium]